MAKAKRKRTAIEVSSGNVFTDLGSPDADERQTKVRLAVASAGYQPAESVRAAEVQARRLFGRAADEFPDGARQRCGDPDQAASRRAAPGPHSFQRHGGLVVPFPEIRQVVVMAGENGEVAVVVEQPEIRDVAAGYVVGHALEIVQIEDGVEDAVIGRQHHEIAVRKGAAYL
jgi:hypothetical protein